MADHEELVSEMAILEQMGTQERQKLAKKRRMQQLKKWAQREKEWITKERQLNKRLANILHEENNGLNLKQYTQYGSAQRSNAKTKKSSDSVDPKNVNNKSQHGAKTNSHNTKEAKTSITANNNNTINNNNIITNSNNISNNNNNNQTKNDNSLVICRKEPESLSPNGRVHFNVGVMLLEAAARNDFEEVKRLLSLGVSPDSINHDGLTALHQCCIDASEPMMILLLEHGANVDARDTEQWTPLHAACTCGHLNLVKILVEHGAELLAVNGDGNMPFDVCEDDTTLDYIESQMVARGITQEMIDLARASTEMQMLNDLEKLVVAGNGSRNSTTLKESLDEPINEDGVTRLHVAAANGYISVIKFLLKNGANVNCCDNDLWRPLHGAACWGNEQHCKVIEMLVEAGADLYAKTTNEETVFDLCDNVELLDKLNQLKDELESRKAATGPDDRLKRTQSRTNSRVHSVRRTSVRDKNQISRREAREEALLRVESNEKVSVTKKEVIDSATETESTEQTDGLKKKVLNGDNNQIQNHRQQETDLDIMETGRQVDRRNSNNNSKDVVDSAAHQPNSSAPTNEVSKVKEKSDIQKSSNQPTNQDTIVGQSDRSQLGPESKSSNEDDIITNNSISNNPCPDVVSHRSNQNGLHSKTIGVLPNSIGDKQSKISIRQTSDSNGKTSVQVAYNSPVQDNKSSNNSNNYMRSNDGNNNNRLKVNNPGDGNNIVPTNSDILSTKQHHVQHQKQQQQHIVATQLIPVNYTLSNLKKHRSDLRMRASSQCLSGSNSVATMNHLSMTDANTQGSSFAISTAPNANFLTDESMQPSMNPSSDSTTAIQVNGQANYERDPHNNTTNGRTESPSMTFRKFHGEPGEVIDIGRASRHKCCILM